MADASGRFVPDQRPARLMEQSEDGTFRVGDVRWGFLEGGGPDAEGNTPIFSDAFIHPDAVREVYMVIEPFAPDWLAAHAFLHFEMPLRDSHGRRDAGWVLSVEARTLKEHSFDAIRGMERTFPIVYQLGSWRDSIMRRCRILGHRLYHCKLALSTDQRRRLAANALREALKDRHDEYFNTLSDSCFSNALRLLNEVLPPRQQVSEWIVPRLLHHLSASLPTYADVELYDRNLLADEPVYMILPDRKRFPEKQVTRGPVWRALRDLSERTSWHAAMRLLSGAVGMVFGAWTGRGRRSRALLHGLVGGYMGQTLGGTVANVVFLRSHMMVEACEDWLEEK